MNANPIIPETTDKRTREAAGAVAELLQGFEVEYSRTLDSETVQTSHLIIDGEHCTHFIEYRDSVLNVGVGDLPGTISPQVAERIADEGRRVARAAAFIEVRQQAGVNVDVLLLQTALAARAECGVPECDQHGEPVPPTHLHEKLIGSIEFESIFIKSAEVRVTLDEKHGEWMIDPEPVNNLITAFDARQLIALLADAAAAADRLNGHEVRRPVNYCAEPEHDGIGGGL